MTSLFKHNHKKSPKTRQRDRANSRKKAQRGSGREKELQLELIPTEQPEPEAKGELKPPRAITVQIAPRSHHGGKERRYWLFNGGVKVNALFHRDEIDYLLAVFGNRRGSVKSSVFNTAADDAIALHYGHSTMEVAA